MPVTIKRREFIAAIGGAVSAWPFAAQAQRAKAATIGLLGTGSAAAQAQWTAAFVQRMRELGGSKAAILRSSIAGAGDAPSALPSFKLHRTSRPPSTIRTEPVTYDASSEASQRIG